jgi:hypothetical protein
MVPFHRPGRCDSCAHLLLAAKKRSAMIMIVSAPRGFRLEHERDGWTGVVGSILYRAVGLWPFGGFYFFFLDAETGPTNRRRPVGARGRQRHFAMGTLGGSG